MRTGSVLHLMAKAVVCSVLISVRTACINSEGGADGIGFELRMGWELRRNTRDGLLVRREPLGALLVHVATVGSLVGLLATHEVEGATTIAVLAVNRTLQSGHCEKEKRRSGWWCRVARNGGSINQ